jgi:CRISPR/Cas system-associated exonuclease Cas4 (RecB family)
LKSYAIPPSKSLIEEVANHLVEKDRDFSSSLVVFPGKRPSHFLRKFLAEREKSGFIPPRIFSMDEFIDFVYEECLGKRDRKLEIIDAVAILHQIHKNSSHPLGRENFLSPDRFFPIGLKLYSDLEELCIEGISPRRVKEIESLGREKIPEPTARRLQSISHFYESFYKTMEEGRWSTRSSRYRSVSDNIDRVDLTPFRRAILAGFSALTRSEKELLGSLLKHENTFFIFQEGSGIDLSGFGIRLEGEQPSGEPELHFYSSPDTHGQVFTVSQLLKDRLQEKEVLDEKTVIVLPSPETLFPLYHHSLNHLKPDEYNVSLGYPLQRTPLFTFFNNVMELILSMEGDRVYVPHYLNVVLHPYVKNIYFEGKAETTRVLFHGIEEGLTRQRTRKFVSLQEIERDETVAQYLKERLLSTEGGNILNRLREHLTSIHENTIGKMLFFNNVGDFARKLKEVIEYIYQNSTARLHPFFYPYAESFVTHLDLVQRSLMKDMEFEERRSYFTLVKKSLMAAYTPFVGTPLRGIQVLGFLETRNIPFDRVFFLDVNEGIVPDATREEFFLPFKARQILGLPTYQDRERLMAYTFETLIRGAKEVHLLYVESDQRVRSRWVEKLLWERQKREGRRDEGKDVRAVQYRVSLQTQAPRPIEKTEEMIEFLRDYSYSPTSLDTYLRCPLQFYYQYVCGLRERETITEEIEREEVGLFVHQVLHDYFRNKIGRILSEKEMSLRELEQTLRSRFEKSYGPSPAGEAYLLRRQIERHLKDFIREYQIPKIKRVPTEIIGLEQRIEVVKDSFRFGVRLDRIEKREDRTVILDYKTSANPKPLTINFRKLNLDTREAWPEVIGTFQLPLYTLIYSEATRSQPKDVDSMFLLLGKTRVDEGIELPLFEDGDHREERLNDLHRIIFILLAEIVDPHRPFEAPRMERRACRSCPLGQICTNQE